MRTCLENRLLDGIGMNRAVVLEADDPRRISAVLAPIPPPTTSQLVTGEKNQDSLKISVIEFYFNSPTPSPLHLLSTRHIVLVVQKTCP